MKHTRIPIAALILFVAVACTKSNYDVLNGLEKKPGDRARATELNKQALGHHQKKEYEKAEALWVDAAKADPSWWKPYYNLACVASLTEHPELSIRYLKLALRVDFDPALIRSMKSDSDLVNARKLPEFQTVIASTRILGNWGGIAMDRQQFSESLPSPYDTYSVAEYQSLGFSSNGRFSWGWTDSQMFGSYTVNGNQVTVHLTEHESEIKLTDQGRVGGTGAIDETVSFHFAVLFPIPTDEGAKAVLCIDWPEKTSAGYSASMGEMGLKECYVKIGEK